jgi:hypothetical protein
MGFFGSKAEPKIEGRKSQIEERIRKLVIEKVSQNVIVRESSRLANSSVSNTADLADLKVIQGEAGIARSRLEEIEGELASAREELSSYQRIQQKPALQQRLTKAKALVDHRNKLAEKVQGSLLEFSDAIRELDKVTDDLHELSRDPDARGVGATASRWHPLNQASRLRAVIALALRGTNYSRLVRQPLLTPPDSAIDFAEVEARVGASLIAELEVEIRQIDTLEKKQEVA